MALSGAAVGGQFCARAYVLPMAGGMSSRRDDWIAQERLRNTSAPPEPAPVKRCWVLDELSGRQPGLLEWRRTAAGWQGRVLHPVRDTAGWVIVEDWINAQLLEADP
jgi:hypothetical protein